MRVALNKMNINWYTIVTRWIKMAVLFTPSLAQHKSICLNTLECHILQTKETNEFQILNPDILCIYN